MANKSCNVPSIMSLYEDLVCIYPFHLINIRVCPLCAHGANGNITSHLTLSTQEENRARKCVTVLQSCGRSVCSLLSAAVCTLFLVTAWTPMMAIGSKRNPRSLPRQYPNLEGLSIIGRSNTSPRRQD